MERNKVIKNKYDVEKYPFRRIFEDHLEKVFGSKDLESIDLSILDRYLPTEIVTVENDQSTYLHKKLYEVDQFYSLKAKKIKKGEFILLYQDFVRHLAKDYFQEDIIFQKKPTLRIHLKGNKSVGDYHRDSEYNHPVEEFNVWVPLTKAVKTSTIQIESSVGSEDYKPFNSVYGEFAIFDGNLKHGNEINVESHSRISFDFRIIRKSEFKDSTKSSVTQKIKFSLSDYYEKLNLN